MSKSMKTCPRKQKIGKIIFSVVLLTANIDQKILILGDSHVRNTAEILQSTILLTANIDQKILILGDSHVRNTAEILQSTMDRTVYFAVYIAQAI
ncbi:hypothetical protein QE152_g17908 [Popillia japonica]|uniref:Uncharacterized protein n=1 Tax=Popillia japonica TaxID=7064 RepID=A0AAW1L534_POPJA